MSSQNPRNPRRRIAGERRPVRPERPLAGTEPTEPTDPTEPIERTAATQTTGGGAEPTRVAGPKRRTRAPRTPRTAATSRRPGTARAGDGPSWALVAGLGAVALVLVVVAAVLGLGVWDLGAVREHDRVTEASRTAPAAAERAAATILSFDYTSLAADKSAAEHYMTAGYKKEYGATFDKLVRPNAGKIHAKVQAEVKASGVSHADADRVNVLLYVNQTTKSTANSGQPQLALNRVMLKMVRSGGGWLVDDITSY